MLAFAMMAAIRYRANTIPNKQTIPQIFVARRLSAGPSRKSRRIANRLAQRRITKPHVIAWSLWRRAHQAAAKQAHLRIKQKAQL